MARRGGFELARMLVRDLTCYTIAAYGSITEIRLTEPRWQMLLFYGALLGVPLFGSAFALLTGGQGQDTSPEPPASPNGARPVDLRHSGRDGGSGGGSATPGSSSRSRRR